MSLSSRMVSPSLHPPSLPKGDWHVFRYHDLPGNVNSIIFYEEWPSSSSNTCPPGAAPRQAGAGVQLEVASSDQDRDVRELLYSVLRIPPTLLLVLKTCPQTGYEEEVDDEEVLPLGEYSSRISSIFANSSCTSEEDGGGEEEGDPAFPEDPALRVVFRSPRVYRSHILDRIAVAWTIQAWKNREGIQDWDLLTSKPLPRSVEDAGIEEMLSMLEKCSIHDQVGNSKLTTSSSSTTTFSAKVQDSPDLQARKFSYRATMHEEIEGPGEEQYSFAEAYPLRTELLQALNALGLEFCRAWAYTEYVVEEIIEDDAGQGSFCLDQGGGKIRSKISSGSSFDSSSSISTSRNSCSTRKTSFSTRGTPTATSCTSSALSSSSSRTSRVRGISSLESIADIDEEDDSACFREDDSTSEVFLPIICSPAEVLFSPRTSQKYSIGGSGSDTGALKHCKNATSSYNADSSSSARPTPVAKKKKKLHWCTLRIVCENGLTNLLRAMVEYADMSPQLGRVFDFQCWALCEQYPDIFLEVLGKPVLHEDPRQKKIGQGLGSRAASRTITKCCTSLHQKVEHEDVKRIIFELSSMAPMEGGDESCMLDDFFGEIVAVVGGGVDHFVDSTTEEEKEVEEVVEGMQTDDLGPQDCDEDEVTRLFLQAQAELEEEEQEQELQGKTTLLGDLLDPANFILGEDSMALEHEAVEEQLQSHHQRPPLQQHKTNYVGDRELTLADLQTIACDCASVQKRLQSLSFRNGPLTRGRNSMTGNGGVLGRTTIGAQELEGAQQFLGPAPVIPAVDHAAAENQQQILGAQLDPSCTVFPSNTAFPSVVLSGEDSGGAGAAGDKKRSRALSSMTAHSSGSSASGGSQIAVVDIDDIGLEWTENENVANLVLKPSSSTTSSTNQRQQSSTYDSTSTTDAGSSLSDEGKNESFSTNWATSAKMGTGKTFFTSAASGTSAPSGTVGKKITTFSNTTSTSETSVHHENAKKNKTTSISSPPKFVLSTFALNCSNECVPSVLGIAVDQYVSLSKPDAKLPSELLDRVRRDHDQQMKTSSMGKSSSSSAVSTKFKTSSMGKSSSSSAVSTKSTTSKKKVDLTMTEAVKSRRALFFQVIQEVLRLRMHVDLDVKVHLDSSKFFPMKYGASLRGFLRSAGVGRQHPELVQLFRDVL